MVLSILESMVNSNAIVYLIIIALIFVSIAMFYLVYSEYHANKKVKDIPLMKEQETVPELVTNDLDDLKDITKELESLPKEKTIKLTPYEEEQEEKAIISYDELVNTNVNSSIEYLDDVNSFDDISVKQVDLEKTGKIELDPLKRENNTKVNVNYQHEEDFLKALKQLNEMLN